MSHFVGYASRTGVPYDMGVWDEIIEPGAFKKTLSEGPDVHFNLAHGAGGSGLPIARTGQNMALSEDAQGLRVDADLDDEDPDVQLLNKKVQGGLLDGMSMAFRVVRQRFENDHELRRMVEINLDAGDVTVVPQGANPWAGIVSLRSLRSMGHLRGPGRETAYERKRLAAQVGQAGIVQFRSVMLDGVGYDLDGSRRAEDGTGRSLTPVLPNYSAAAKLALARLRDPVHDMVVNDVRASRLGDPVADARRALAEARRRAR